MMFNGLLREEVLPIFNCSGCGEGTILRSILTAMEKLGWTKENTVVVTGIGCWGKTGGTYFNASTICSTHGRVPAVATGVAMANPDLNVLCIMGDGDGITIGGNHLIHAARRNVNLTVIMANNLNYGMTGGQYSGTTPMDYYTQTSQYGHSENGFDVCGVIKAAGGSFAARGTTYDVVQLNRLIEQAMTHKGFSFVEVISQCPTHFGKNNKMSAVEQLKWIKANTVTVQAAKDMSDEELDGKFVTGVIVDREQDDLATVYARLQERAKGGLK